MWSKVRLSEDCIYLKFGGIGFAEFLVKLKSSIPSLSREFDPIYREWKIDREWIERVQSLLSEHGNRNSQLATAIDYERITEPTGEGLEAAIAKAIEATKGNGE